jgi:putative endonuclease
MIMISYELGANVQPRRSLINTVFSPVAGATTQVAATATRCSSADASGGAPYNSAVHFVYIVRCCDGTLYTGYARDPRQREKAHNSGRGARYTSGRLPVTLTYSESFGSKSEALKREWELKRWSRAKKEALIRDGGR